MYGVVACGDKVRDPITGFEGIVVSRTEYLFGCVRVAVQGEDDRDGKMTDPRWYDEPQLDVVKPGVYRPVLTAVQQMDQSEAARMPQMSSTGGPDRPRDPGR